MQEILSLIDNQKQNLLNSPLKSVKYRVELLKKLRQNVVEMQEEITLALNLDLCKCSAESYMCEIGGVLSELSYFIKNCKKFAKIKKVKTPFSQFPSKSYIKPCAYGQVLIISPWNYPFLLTIQPIINAISAGNSVVVKPSATSKNTQQVIKKLIDKTFTCNEVVCVMGGRDSCDFLLDLNWDYIFFTGGERAGGLVLQKASQKRIPVTLELGGKSPCIVDETAKIELSAKRIIFGKLLNAGQTCIAPDYIYCHSSIKEQLIQELIKQIKLQYGENPLENENYPKLINKRQFDNVKSLIPTERVLFGGNYCEELLKIEPTIIDANLSDKCMQQEIFGPLIPVVTFDYLEQIVSRLNALPKPLALYVFSSDKRNIDRLISGCDFGGGCVNDTIIHVSSSVLPFGGVGNSGIGCYHGKFGFDTFTHYKSIVDKKTCIDMPMRYQPISKKAEKTIKKFLK